MIASFLHAPTNIEISLEYANTKDSVVGPSKVRTGRNNPSLTCISVLYSDNKIEMIASKYPEWWMKVELKTRALSNYKFIRFPAMPQQKIIDTFNKWKNLHR